MPSYLTTCQWILITGIHSEPGGVVSFLQPCGTAALDGKWLLGRNGPIAGTADTSFGETEDSLYDSSRVASETCPSRSLLYGGRRYLDPWCSWYLRCYFKVDTSEFDPNT